MNRRLIGVLGGTFDPIHRGHTQLARDALGALGLDELRCVPAGKPPHRPAPGAGASDRLAMARLAFADQPGCVIDDAEIGQSGPSWTVLTLARLRALYADAGLVLIVGADAFLGLPSWHRWQELIGLAHIAVANRPGSDLDPAAMPERLKNFFLTHATTDVSALKHSTAGSIVSFTMTPCVVSATQIRLAVHQRQSIAKLVSPQVESYIYHHHLYA
jgi:nicotinate-nucleotide adenylyltransferase